MRCLYQQIEDQRKRSENIEKCLPVLQRQKISLETELERERFDQTANVFERQLFGRSGVSFFVVDASKSVEEQTRDFVLTVFNFVEKTKCTRLIFVYNFSNPNVALSDYNSTWLRAQWSIPTNQEFPTKNPPNMLTYSNQFYLSPDRDEIHAKFSAFLKSTNARIWFRPSWGSCDDGGAYVSCIYIYTLIMSEKLLLTAPVRVTYYCACDL